MCKVTQNIVTDLNEQPALMNDLISTLTEFSTGTPWWDENYKRVLIIARGSSARVGELLVRSVAKSHPGLVTSFSPTDITADQDLRNVLVIAISQSGSTDEVVRAAALAQQNHAYVIAITNDPQSQLAKHCDYLVNLNLGPERAVPATKTVTATALVLLMIANVINGQKIESKQWLLLPDLIQKVLKSKSNGLAQIPAFVLSRGVGTPIAMEAALKFTEITKVPVVALSANDFLHGTTAALKPSDEVLLISLADDDLPGGLDLVKKHLEAKAINWHVIDSSMFCNSDFPSSLQAIISLVQVQVCVLETCINLGIDPDQDVGLTKITKT